MTARGRSKPTLDDVAARAHVSRATASRVLNGGVRSANAISDETRDAIETAARELDYSPNGQAQSMAAGANTTLAVLISEIDDLGAAELVAGASDTARELGYSVVVVLAGLSQDEELDALRSIRGQRPHALLVAVSRTSDATREHAFGAELQAYVSAGGRVAVVGDNNFPFETVGFANADAAGSLADALVGLGYRRFAMVGSSAESLTPGERMRGFTAGLGRHDISIADALLVEDEFDSNGGYRAAGQLLSRIDDFDLIFAASDAMALGVIARLREHGIEVPSQIAVAGFDDVPFVRDLNPPLTSVRVPLRQLAERAVRRLLHSHAAPALSTTAGAASGTPVLRGSTPRLD
jgi:LacI family transcriptional regulator